MHPVIVSVILCLHILSITPEKTTITVAAATITKPECKLTQCGNVTVPYPFSFEPGCAMTPDFEIKCNTSYYPYINFGNRTFKIYDISDAELRVSNKLAFNCYDTSGRSFRNFAIDINLEGTPYSFSEANRFTLVGCDDYALVQGSDGSKSYTSGCLSLCSYVSDAVEGECSGIGCCQTPVSRGLKYYNISLGSFETRRSLPISNPCSHLFLGEQDKFTFQGASDIRNYLDFWKRITNSVPIVLDWAIGNLNCSEAQKQSNYTCHDNSHCVDSGQGYRCMCDDGYVGNPYLKPGCQDIDECAHPNKHDCAMNCTNTPGSYYCWCPHQFLGDGRMNGTGCNLHQVKFPVVKLILGLGFGILSLFTVIPSFYLAIKRRKLIKLKEKFFQQNGGLMLNQHFSTRKKGEKSPRVFTDEELKKATNNYAEDRILGRGGSGIVYKGNIDKREVAIKKAKIVSQNQIEQFINEVIILTQVNHRHVVELIGCCLETEVPSLVYEFISNGTLSNHIRNHHNHERVQEKWDFSWENRLRIAAEAAGALAYLHSAASTPVIHGDVKSANILLDENYTAKIADFGASRLVPLDQALVMTLVQGTFGYLDPECFRSHQLTEKSDVYSFGVVLAELLTGNRPVFKDKSSEQEINLATYFVMSMEENCLLEIIEPRILSEETSDRLQQVGLLVKKCLSLNSKERPTMKEVANELEKLWNSNKYHIHSGQQDDGANKLILLPSERHVISIYPDNTNTDEEESETSQLFFSAKST